MMSVEQGSKQQEHRSAKKKQKSPTYVSIGSPMAPVRPKAKKQDREVLSDWVHSS